MVQPCLAGEKCACHLTKLIGREGRCRAHSIDGLASEWSTLLAVGKMTRRPRRHSVGQRQRMMRQFQDAERAGSAPFYPRKPPSFGIRPQRRQWQMALCRRSSTWLLPEVRTRNGTVPINRKSECLGERLIDALTTLLDVHGLVCQSKLAEQRAKIRYAPLNRGGACFAANTPRLVASASSGSRRLLLAERDLVLEGFPWKQFVGP